MKRVMILLLFLLFITGCTNLNNVGTNLNELQEQACNTASKYDTCGKLQDIAIVSKDECCKELRKCC
ncbi:MAG: hypothetical protein NT139_02550 [Candidatus Woesearchaeota archaeon]|nr:hypothetical protein [Candidatus Woesearchaeota archaeon]